MLRLSFPYTMTPQQYWISETAPTWAIFRMNEQLLICRLAWHHFGRYFGDNWKPKTSQIWFLYICSKIWDLASDLLQIETWLHHCPALNPALNWIILSLEFLSTRDQDRQSSSSDRKDDDLHKAYLSFLVSSKAVIPGCKAISGTASTSVTLGTFSMRRSIMVVRKRVHTGVIFRRLRILLWNHGYRCIISRHWLRCSTFSAIFCNFRYHI